MRGHRQDGGVRRHLLPAEPGARRLGHRNAARSSGAQLEHRLDVGVNDKTSRCSARVGPRGGAQTHKAGSGRQDLPTTTSATTTRQRRRLGRTTHRHDLLDQRGTTMDTCMTGRHATRNERRGDDTARTGHSGATTSATTRAHTTRRPATCSSRWPGRARASTRTSASIP